MTIILITLIMLIYSVIANYRMHRIRTLAKQTSEYIHVENYLSEFNGDIDKAFNKANALVNETYKPGVLMSLMIWKPIKPHFDRMMTKI